MDAKAVFEFLSFLGAGRPNFGTRPSWRPNELQYASVYFGLAGEDAVIRTVFKHFLGTNTPGCYVDVGCAWPTCISNTYYLYTVGWRGIGVDANKAFAPLWAKPRPEDVFIWGAVAEDRKQLYWAEHRSNLGASIVSDTSAPPTGEHTAGIPVPSLRLDEIFDRYIGEKHINFLNLDVERTELSVLKSNDWSRWMPDVVLMESGDFSFEAPYADPSVAFLRDRGYKLCDKVGANVLMIHTDAKITP
ncbi:MAG: FkbM family methyltransferase [Rhodospirillaceae bacterium]